MNTIKWLSVLVLCTSLFTLKAQDNNEEDRSSVGPRRKLVFGSKAGWIRSNVYDQGTYQFVANPKTGITAGFFMAIPIGRLLGLQPELIFAQKGFKGTGVMDGEAYQFTRTTNHLDIPIQLQFKPFGFISFLGGIQYSYVLSQSDEISSPTKYEQINSTFNNDNIRRNLFGAIMGADITLWHLVFSARTGWDLMYNNGEGGSVSPRYKNFWVQAMIGFRIY